MKFSWEMENAPSLAPRHAGAPQTIVITSKFIGPGGVRSDRNSQNSLEIIYFALFGNFPAEFNKIEEFLEIWGNLAKRRSLGGPAHRSLYFLRNIKVSEPPECAQFVISMKSDEIS